MHSLIGFIREEKNGCRMCVKNSAIALWHYSALTGSKKKKMAWKTSPAATAECTCERENPFICANMWKLQTKGQKRKCLVVGKALRDTPVWWIDSSQGFLAGMLLNIFLLKFLPKFWVLNHLILLPKWNWCVRISPQIFFPHRSWPMHKNTSGNWWTSA